MKMGFAFTPVSVQIGHVKEANIWPEIKLADRGTSQSHCKPSQILYTYTHTHTHTHTEKLVLSHLESQTTR